VNIINIIRNEPVVISDLIKMGLLLLTAFAVDVSDGQQVAILGFVTAVLTVIARASVTPMAKLDPQ
jgi:hypothetical protein